MSEPFAELIAARANDHSGYGTGWRDALIAAAKDKRYAAAPDMCDALEAYERLDQQVANCEEHAPEMAPETCADCFPLADDARLKMRAALAKARSEAPKVQAGQPIEASQANQPQE